MRKTHRAVGEKSEAAISQGLINNFCWSRLLLSVRFVLLWPSDSFLLFASELFPLQCSKNLTSITCVGGDERINLELWDFPTSELS